MVVWIIGLSGSGKTTLAEQVTARLRDEGRTVVMLDGDIVRELFKNDVDHSIEGRRRNAERLSRLTRFLADQGVDVVAAVLSIFPDWRAWNRQNVPGYREVYLKASMETLLRRETKSLYARALRGEMNNVVGVDIPFPEPENPDLILDNNIDRTDFEEMVSSIVSLAMQEQGSHKA
jgi:adenylylsulfate kinase-like enzyme